MTEEMVFGLDDFTSISLMCPEVLHGIHRKNYGISHGWSPEVSQSGMHGRVLGRRRRA